MSNRAGKWVCGLLLLCLCLSYIVEDVAADTSTSPSYRFEESVIGTGGLIDSSSTNYRVTESIGDNAVGDTSSTNFQTTAGSKTTNDPALSFAITSSAANFTPFSPSTASTATATFAVSNYTSYGYVVQVVGNPPTHYGGHTIPAMGTTGASVPGTEQFGINLVANTSPTNFGANPAQGYFGFGTATGNYDTANQFRYVSGESIATAPKSSGITNYTISYIINVDSLTPGGQYIANQTLITTGTY